MTVTVSYQDTIEHEYLVKNKSKIQSMYKEISERRRKNNNSSLFLNYGYLSEDEDIFDSLMESNYVDKNSINLLVKVIGNCIIKDKKVIEVGCGHGGNLQILRDFYNPLFVVGMDISLENIMKCKEKLRDSSLFLVGDAENIPIAKEYFDVLINIESSLHYSNIVKFFLEAYKILTPGGVLLYADMIHINEVQSREIILRNLNYEIIRNEDITFNVILSLEEKKSKTQNSSFNSMYFSKNKLYEEMKCGEVVYKIYTLRKPN